MTTEKPIKGEAGMTPETFAEKMAELYIRDPDDYGVNQEYECHILADALMCETLRALGYDKGVTLFEQAEKMYA